MIVPMYKYTFLVFHSAYKDFLRDIRRIGVVHIQEKVKEPTPEMQDIFRQLTEVEKAVQKMETMEPEASGEKPGFKTGEEVFTRLKEMEKEMEHNHHQLVQLEKEKILLEPWGEFEWDRIRELEKHGVKIRFMACPVNKFNPEWETEFLLHSIGEREGLHYFVKIEKAGNGFLENGFEEVTGADEFILPDRSLNQVKQEIDRLKQKSDDLKKELHEIARFCKPLLKKYFSGLQKHFAEQNALLQTTEEVEGKVKLLEGWVPKTKQADLDSYLEENQILYTSEKPSGEDKVPVLLKNNRFNKLYEVIGDLYDLPNHRELDLVPFFAPFYMMFFGFALGDAGYGLIIMAAAEFLKRKKPALRPVLKLAQWLGFSTVIFGILTGTFFGIDLINSDISWLEKFKTYMIDTNKLFDLALIFGAVQIIFGMFLKVVNVSRMQGFRYSLSTVGWLVLILGMGSLYGLKNAELIHPQTAGIAQNIVLIVAGVFILLLNHPKRNIFMNIGVGLWDVYSMATGLLGDILSYIRLFALGISSAILGLVFNNMAMNMKPDHVILGPLVMIIILIVGHTITIFMSTLGAFVHPIRLTFVEFYKNAGFTGGGKAYKPFAESAPETTE
jgi:V/A-type H+/Na+-transporting ATPase subunit I